MTGIFLDQGLSHLFSFIVRGGRGGDTSLPHWHRLNKEMHRARSMAPVTTERGRGEREKSQGKIKKKGKERRPILNPSFIQKR